jgi:phosphate transport system ATP-binding protein
VSEITARDAAESDSLIDEVASAATDVLLDEMILGESSVRTRRSTQTMLSIRDLSVNYGSKRVVEGVSFEIPRNNITAFIGPSGCGKSTVLRCFNRMNDEISSFSMGGKIEIGGQDIYAPGVHVTALRRVVGMVFQQPNPFPMSVHDNIGLAVREHNPRLSRARVDEIVEESLRQANLWDEVKDSLKDSGLALSGGQQQRLCIARALAVKPSIIMLDEPCASLDPISTAKIEELLLDLSEHYTIVIVTHNLGQAQRIADKTGFFLMGRLIEVGDTSRVFGAPERKETAEYIRGSFG